MVLGRYLQDDMIKASHIYKRDWPAQTAVTLSFACLLLQLLSVCCHDTSCIVQALLKLGVDTAANLFSAQKKIESAFDNFRLIIVPSNLSDYTVSSSLLDLFAWGVRRCHHSAKSHNWFCGVQLHILDPSLDFEMIKSSTPQGLQSNLQTLMVLHCSLSQKHAPPSKHLLGTLKRLYILAKLLVGLLHPC